MRAPFWEVNDLEGWNCSGPTLGPVHAAVEHISKAMPHVGGTMDMHHFFSTIATEEELLHLWNAPPDASHGQYV